MKKLIIGTVLGAATVASTFAQGNVSFNNSTSSKISVNSALGGAATGTTSATAGSYYYALFYSTTTSTVNGSSTSVLPTTQTAPLFVFNDAGWTLGSTANGPAYAANGAAGKFASTVTGTDGVTTSLNNANIGAADYFVVIGWSSNIGSTIASVQSWLAGNDGALTGYIGESNPSSLITTGITGSTPNATIFGTGAGLDNPFVLGQYTPVTTPEPTSIALGVMGAASLLALRRKKA